MTIPATPSPTVRLALDKAGDALNDIGEALARVRTEVADAYGRTGTALTEAGNSIGTAEERRKEAEHRAETAEAKLAEATHQISILYAVDEGRAHGARRIMNERDQAQARAEKAEQRVAELETDRDAIHEALSLAPGQLHDVAVSAILGRGHTIGELIQRAKAAEADAERFKADHLAACKTIADMHEAATGRIGMGPIRGVVEDVADMRDRANMWKRIAREAEADRDREAAAREQAQQEADEHRRNLAAVFALDADTPFEEIREYAARTLTRSGERLLTAQHAADRWKATALDADATLQRVRDADTLADALTAVGEHDGLPPEAARAAANIAAAAEQPAVVDAEREREHALRLAAAEQARAEAVRGAERATQTLLRIKHAATAADAWVAIGEHFHMASTDAGRGARRWRNAAVTVAERHAQRAEADAKQLAERLRAAEEQAETASVLGTRYMGDAERFQAAWHNARRRATYWRDVAEQYRNVWQTAEQNRGECCDCPHEMEQTR